jgi:hypothetical protein
MTLGSVKGPSPPKINVEVSLNRAMLLEFIGQGILPEKTNTGACLKKRRGFPLFASREAVVSII